MPDDGGVMADSMVVVITGASAAPMPPLARDLGAAGRTVVLAARRGDALRAVAAETEARGAAATLVVETDVTRRESVNALRDAALARFGRVDAWVNNAGRGITRSVMDLTDADVDEVMAVNVKSALYGMQAIVPHFQRQGGGHLINVSSFLGRVPVASIRSIYSAAKAALNSLTANLRTDLAASHPGIHVSLVMPGIVTTDFARNALGAIPTHAPGGPPPGGPMQPQTAEAVAAMIADLLEHPTAELYTNPASAEIARRYFADVADFEAGVRTRQG
jgi:short-subunit dehydrogenase